MVVVDVVVVDVAVVLVVEGVAVELGVVVVEALSVDVGAESDVVLDTTEVDTEASASLGDVSEPHAATDVVITAMRPSVLIVARRTMRPYRTTAMPHWATWASSTIGSWSAS